MFEVSWFDFAELVKICFIAGVSFNRNIESSELFYLYFIKISVSGGIVFAVRCSGCGFYSRLRLPQRY